MAQNKNPVPKGDLSKILPTGVLFITYSLLVSKVGGSNAPKPPKKVVVPKARRQPYNLLAAMSGEGGCKIIRLQIWVIVLEPGPAAWQGKS